MLESGGPGETLSRRALNRATLARQLLLERSAMPVHAALEHLVWLEAQREGGSNEMATMAIRPLVGLSAAARRELEAEGIALLAFAAADASGHAVRFEPVGGGR